MARSKGLVKTILAMLAGALLLLVVQEVGDHWNRRADAASIDQLARSFVINPLQSLPWPGGEKIRGVCGLGDGRTFIVYTDETIQFYQFGLPSSSSSGR